MSTTTRPGITREAAAQWLAAQPYDGPAGNYRRREENFGLGAREWLLVVDAYRQAKAAALFTPLNPEERRALSLKLRQAIDNLLAGNFGATEWQRNARDLATEIAGVRGDLHAPH